MLDREWDTYKPPIPQQAPAELPIQVFVQFCCAPHKPFVETGIGLPLAKHPVSQYFSSSPPRARHLRTERQ
jgi:hypothetical protein